MSRILLAIPVLTVACTDPLFQPLPEPKPAKTGGDVIPPTVRFVSPANNDVLAGVVRWEMDITDDGPIGSVEFRDGRTNPVATLNNPVAGVWAIDYDTVAHGDGENIRLEVIATDAHSNAGSAFLFVDIDNTAPTVDTMPIFNPTAAGASGTVTISFAVSEVLAEPPEVTVGTQAAELTSQSGDGLSFTFTYTISGSEPEGQTDVDIALVDRAGNSGAGPDTVSLWFDRTPPSVGSPEIDGDGTFIAPGFTLSATFSDTGSGVVTCERCLSFDDDCTGEWDAATVVADTCTFQSTSCTDNAVHWFAMRATDRAGNVGESTTISQICDAVAPGTPGDVTAAGTGHDAVEVAWTPSTDHGSGVVGYNIHYGPDDNFGGTGAAEGDSPFVCTTNSPCLLSALPPCTTLTVGVAAIDSVGNDSSPDSTVQTVTTWCGADGTFGAPSTTTAPANIADLAIGDIDRDQILDIVVATADGDVQVYFGGGTSGRGNGTFTTGAPAVTSLGAPITDIELVDLDNDNILDLIVAAGGVSIFLGDGSDAVGTGQFTAGNSYSFGAITSVDVVLAADFTDDGDLDLVAIVTLAGGAGQLTLDPGQGNGSFGAATTTLAVDQSTAARPGDFNNDGILDLAVMSMVWDTVNVLLGQGSAGIGTGVLASAGTLANVASNPEGLCVTDLDRDGNQDIVLGTAGNPNGLQRFYGQGSGTFDNPLNQLAGLQGITCGDINGDHAMDIVVATASEVVVVVADEPPTFIEQSHLTPGLMPNEVALADFNNDGVLDVVTWAGSADNFVVFLGEGTNRIYSGSWTEDNSSFSSQSIVALTAADFNNDGVLDLAAAGADSYYTWLGDAYAPGRGNGLFTPASTIAATTSGPVAIATGDDNNDEFIDLVTIHGSDATTSFHARCGPGDGTFDATVITAEMVGNQRDGIVGDFNGDDLLDVVVLALTGGIYPWFGNGSNGVHDGDFSVPGSSAFNMVGGKSLATADLNNDHHLDLVVLTDSGLSIALGDGIGFAVANTYPLAGGANAVAIADFNEDGMLDLAVAHAGFALTIFEGGGSGDFTADYTTPTFEVVALTAADLNRDGITDLVGAGASAISTFLGAGSDGRGDGDFQASSTTSFSLSGATFTDLLVFDVDANGTLDLVVSSAQGAKVIRDLGVP